jgi:hypothetical protein
MQTFLDGVIRFHKGLFASPLWVKLWVLALGGTLMGGPLFFWGNSEAKIIFGLMMLSAMFMMWLTGKYGFVRLLGVGHALFFPMLALILGRLPKYPADTEFGVYLRAAAAVIIISLIFDISDIIRYLKGERKEMARIR